MFVPPFGTISSATVLITSTPASWQTLLAAFATASVFAPASRRVISSADNVPAFMPLFKIHEPSALTISLLNPATHMLGVGDGAGVPTVVVLLHAEVIVTDSQVRADSAETGGFEDELSLLLQAAKRLVIARPKIKIRPNIFPP